MSPSGTVLWWSALLVLLRSSAVDADGELKRLGTADSRQRAEDLCESPDSELLQAASLLQSSASQAKADFRNSKADQLVADSEAELEVHQTEQDASMEKNLSRIDGAQLQFLTDDEDMEEYFREPARLCWKPPSLSIGDVFDENYTAVWVAPDAACPEECPFSAGLAEEPCYKACVKAEFCPALHPFNVFADPHSLECAPTCGMEFKDIVVGCVNCGGPGRCEKCNSFSTLIDLGDRTECKDNWAPFFRCLYYVCQFMFVSLGASILYVQLLPTLNWGTLARAAIFRHATRPWKIVRQQQGQSEVVQVKQWPLTTATHRQDVSGLGVAMYFRWMRFLICLTTFISGATFMTYHVDFDLLTMQAKSANSIDAMLGTMNFWSDEAYAPSKCPATADGKQQNQSVLEPKNQEERGFAIGKPVLLFEPGYGLLEVRHMERFQGKPRVRAMKKVKLKIKTKPKIRPKAGGGGREDSDSRPAGDIADFPKRMALAMCTIYLFVAAVSLWFIRCQHQFALEWKSKRKLYADFVVTMHGLPDMRRPGELRSRVQELLDSCVSEENYQVVNVSIAFDLSDNTDAAYVAKYVDCLSTCLEDSIRTTPQWSRVEGLLPDNVSPAASVYWESDGEEKQEPSQRRQSGMPADSLESAASMRSNRSGMGRVSYDVTEGLATWRKSIEEFAVDPSVYVRHSLQRLFVGPNQHIDDCWTEECRVFLDELQGSGWAYVTVSSERARDKLLSLSSTRLPGTDSTVLFTRTEAEPNCINWEAFGHDHTWGDVLGHTCRLSGTIVLWAVFYVPYAMYNMTAVAVPGEEMSAAEDFVLGLLIAVGNQLVTTVIDVIVGQMGFQEREIKEGAGMVLVFLATLVNTALDIGIVFMVMRKESLTFALAGTLDESHYDRILCRELFMLVVPGYLITPYVTAPLFEDIFPWFISTRIIRSSPRMCERSAERKLCCTEYDVSWRYADVLTNFSVGFALLLFETPYMYQIMIWLIISLVIIYVSDHIRFLRYTTSMYYPTEYLSILFSYWWSVPTGFLGALAVFWMFESKMGQGFSHIIAGWQRGFLLAAFLVHCFLFCVAVRWIRSAEPPNNEAVVVAGADHGDANGTYVKEPHNIYRCLGSDARIFYDKGAWRLSVLGYTHGKRCEYYYDASTDLPVDSSLVWRSVDGSRSCTAQVRALRYEQIREEHLLEMKTYNYCNTNPVAVLKSWFLQTDEDEAEVNMVPYIKGKEHLFFPRAAHDDWRDVRDHAAPVSDKLFQVVELRHRELRELTRCFWEREAGVKKHESDLVSSIGIRHSMPAAA